MRSFRRGEASANFGVSNNMLCASQTLTQLYQWLRVRWGLSSPFDFLAPTSMFSSCTSSQFTMQNNMKSTREMHILIQKYPSQAISPWPPVARSPTEPPPSCWPLQALTTMLFGTASWQQLSYLDGGAPCSSTCCCALTTASPDDDHRPRHPWPPTCNIRLNAGASWELVFSLIYALCCSETVAQVLRVSRCMNFLCTWLFRAWIIQYKYSSGRSCY